MIKRNGAFFFFFFLIPNTDDINWNFFKNYKKCYISQLIFRFATIRSFSWDFLIQKLET